MDIPEDNTDSRDSGSEEEVESDEELDCVLMLTIAHNLWNIGYGT